MAFGFGCCHHGDRGGAAVEAWERAYPSCRKTSDRSRSSPPFRVGGFPRRALCKGRRQQVAFAWQLLPRCVGFVVPVTVTDDRVRFWPNQGHHRTISAACKQFCLQRLLDWLVFLRLAVFRHASRCSCSRKTTVSSAASTFSNIRCTKRLNTRTLFWMRAGKRVYTFVNSVLC